MAERQPSYKDEEGELKEPQLRQRGLTFRGQLHLEEETDFSRSGGADRAEEAFDPREHLFLSPEASE